MSEIRIYAATTGNCIAGDRREYSDAEQNRVESDFRTGVRFVIDERRTEIRGFVPAYRGTQEAFYAVFSSNDSPVTAVEFVEAVRNFFQQVDNWSVRYDTADGRLLEVLSKPCAKEQSKLPIDRLSKKHQVRVSAPDLETAGSQLQTVRSVRTVETPLQYVLSRSKSHPHLSPDLLFHVSNSYEEMAVLTD